MPAGNSGKKLKNKATKITYSMVIVEVVVGKLWVPKLVSILGLVERRRQMGQGGRQLHKDVSGQPRHHLAKVKAQGHSDFVDCTVKVMKNSCLSFLLSILCQLHLL